MKNKIRPYERETLNYAYLGNFKGVAVTYYGARILLDTRNMQHFMLITHGAYEKGISWAIEENLKKEETMIDVGANIGFFTMLGCHIVGPKGKVIAMEPNPEIFHMLEESLFANAYRPRCDWHNIAAFNTEGKMDFTWETGRHGGGRVITPSIKRIGDNQRSVRTARIDDLVSPDRYPISLIKIDTEGSEPYVLEGAENTIRNNPNCTVIMEFSSTMIKDRDYSVDKALALIDAHFNNIERIDGIKKTTKISIDDLRKVRHTNIILRQ